MKRNAVYKNITILLIIVCLFLSGCGSGGSTTNTDKKTITIGYTSFASGNLTAFGKIADNAIQMALEDFNKNAEVPVKLQFEDIGSTPVTAKQGVEKLLASNPTCVDLIISSTQFSAVQDLLVQADIPCVSATALYSIYEHGWDWIYGVLTTDKEGVMLGLKYWHENLGKNKVAVLLPNDDTGKSVIQALQEEASKNNVTIIPIMFQPGDNDYTANITAARRENPDFYFCYSQVTPDLGRIVKQMRQLGIPADSISVSNLIQGTDFLALLTPQEAEGLYGYHAIYVDKSNPKIADWAKRYKEKYGTEPDSVALMDYDSAMLLFNAASKAGGDKEKIEEYLRAGYTGLAASYNFDSKGLARHDIFIMQIGPNKTVKVLDNVKKTDQ